MFPKADEKSGNDFGANLWFVEKKQVVVAW